MPDELPQGDVDLIVDLAGGDAMSALWPCLRPGGILIGIASEPSEAEAAEHQARAKFFIVEPNGAELAAMIRLAETGLIQPTASQVFPLEEADEAFEAVDHHRTRGKVVLAVSPS